MNSSNDKLKSLSDSLDGDFFTDNQTRILYATDASAYREMPLAVAIPRSVADLEKLILFAAKEGISLIPRTAGTSLAGQVVGHGIVVDVSKYFNKILELNVEERWIKVQPGVVRDELNLYLKPFGLYFGPETSTANRAMIGGMVGNNSCGSNSLIYGSTREHTLEIKALLSDGSAADFKALEFDEFIKKCEGNSLENELYRNIRALLSNYENQLSIRQEFPAKSIHRRNTGYAVDILLDTSPFTAETADFNFCKLIAGSEGTLAFITEIKLNLEPILKEETALLCIHFNSIDDALMANLIALKYEPRVSELIDHLILECTKENIEQSKNRFFVSGDPAAILVVEYSGKDKEEITAKATSVEAEMRANGLGYHFPLVFGPDMSRIWSLRKAGLGLLSNLPGDEKAVAVIEDTAVDVKDLPAYIRDFNEILKKHGLFSVHYAHAGSGEIHLRPILNLKTVEGNRLFRVIAEEIAKLVKQYNGSLSGEHGDGRLRGEFIEQMIGPRNYKMIREIKSVWDPKNIFNPGKITDTPAMDTMLRYEPGQRAPEIKTVFRYQGQNILQHAEQCNGSGDCRKSHLAGGTMCPSFMATRNEKDTTRARANMLREMLTHSTKINRFDHQELKDVMDLCLSCKGCKSECPSNVDMAKLKAEFLQGYYDANGVPLKTWIVAGFNQINQMASLSPRLYNWSIGNKTTNALIKKTCGFARERSLPLLYKTTLKKWFIEHRLLAETVPGKGISAGEVTGADMGKAVDAKQKIVYFFCDEFTNYLDTEIGIKAVLLLEKLGYQVIIPQHLESGRTWISKGLLRKAKKIAQHNVFRLSKIITEETPLIGIEPSAILTFRDEYIDLVDLPQLEIAQQLAKNSLLIDEFIAREMENGNISQSSFSKESRLIQLHGHCQQKAWAAMGASKQILAFPENYKVEIIPSGCCGMAGSFGYEKNHYELSMQIGELVLFPEVRKQAADVIIAATGTSCRHQIKDGTTKKALHPVEVLYEALV
ncbi:FAD-binding and (Fe-S)-binding domain-containing protein [Pedobacter cryoconitis]|uniref:FAD/FMN-containing dehydrogenase n=1 Tax=Pedobacter cryoconitis TaxID=188932 RepID=A0A327SPB6_9SPHI|nr:FAD-binding and (Fe-S)-binding domain-containing protein [Pedobacter cryoconitis]RAJ31126.1 FAD/FMN-containing dehydrogenase [Pedobacter cryoconitis]